MSIPHPKRREPKPVRGQSFLQRIHSQFNWLIYFRIQHVYLPHKGEFRLTTKTYELVSEYNRLGRELKVQLMKEKLRNAISYCTDCRDFTSGNLKEYKKWDAKLAKYKAELDTLTDTSSKRE